MKESLFNQALVEARNRDVKVFKGDKTGLIINGVFLEMDQRKVDEFLENAKEKSYQETAEKLFGVRCLVQIRKEEVDIYTSGKEPRHLILNENGIIYCEKITL